MALQLLKRNYTMQGYEVPKILKLPQGEMRWAPRRLPVDIGDVMMNIRMDDNKTRYVGESISKYSQGLNPYGEWGYPYKVNKNNIRPPIIDPKYYEALSRMPVKFDSVTAGPIVKDLYGKRVAIAKVAPQTIIDKVCPDAAPRASTTRSYQADNMGYREGNIDLHLKQPHASIPYWPSIPVHLNTGVPQMELDRTLVYGAQAGIHFPYHVSDQSRDVNNMRTPMHVAFKPGYKDPFTSVYATPEAVTEIQDDQLNVAAQSGVKFPWTVEPEARTDYPLAPEIQIAAQSNIIAPTPTIDNLTRDGYDLAPKVQTSAWYNPSYYMCDVGYGIGGPDEKCVTDKLHTAGKANPNLQLVDITDKQISARIDDHLDDKIHTAGQAPLGYKMNRHGENDTTVRTRSALNVSQGTNVSWLRQDSEHGNVELDDALALGEFGPKANVPTIQQHPEYNRARSTGTQEYFFVGNSKPSHSEKFSPEEFRTEPEINRKQAFVPAGEAPPSRPRISGIKNRLHTQIPRVDRTGVQNPDRVSPVGTGRFVHNRTVI